jgi:hypothetical protein
MKFFKEIGLANITDENINKWINAGFEIRYKDDTIELWYEDNLTEKAA